MLIIADKRLPGEALQKLGDHGEVVPFETSGITYEAVAGHPDIFFCRVNETLIVAPNLPSFYLNLLQERKIGFITGDEPVGSKYPETARYNAVSTGQHLLHNFRYTDSKITGYAGDLDLVHLNQGYARCNIIPIGDDRFITSDEGVYRTLVRHDIKALLVSPEGILLPGFKHGFIGGAAGVRGDAVFFSGSLHHYRDGAAVRKFLSDESCRIIELYDGPLFDGGSIFFID